MPSQGEGFTPDLRIKRRSQFLKIQEEGRKYRSQFFIVSVLPQVKQAKAPAVTAPRIGITITTKIDKRATRRNTLRRRIREIFRRGWREVHFSADIVIIALKGSTELNYIQIRDELCHLLEMAKRRISRNPGRNPAQNRVESSRRAKD